MSIPPPSPETASPSQPEALSIPNDTSAIFRAVSDHPCKWLALATLSLATEPISFWQITKVVDSAQGAEAAILIELLGSNPVQWYCDHSFASARLIATTFTASNTRQYALSERGQMAAAVAGVLIRHQARREDINIAELFGHNKGPKAPGDTALDILVKIANRSLTEYVPLRHICRATSTKDYEGLEVLLKNGVLEKIVNDRGSRLFAIDLPKTTYVLKRASVESRLAYQVAVELASQDYTHITGAQLEQGILAISPDTKMDDVWRRFAAEMPRFLVRVVAQGFEKPNDKVAVRIRPGYSAFVEEFLSDIAELGVKPTAQHAARQYAQDVLLHQPSLVARLVKQGYATEQSPYYGAIPAPDYEGWHQGKNSTKQWRPSLPRPAPQVDMAQIALRMENLSPRLAASDALTNNEVAEALRQYIRRRAGKATSGGTALPEQG